MRGAIFDVDGTILDSMQIWWAATGKYFDSIGVNFNAEVAEEVRELALEESLPLLIDRYKLNITPEEAIIAMKNIVKETYKTTVPIKKGCKEYIEQLHNDGVKIAVATSGFKDICETAFETVGISEYIDAYAFSSEVGVGKDKPDVYLLAAEKIGIKPHDCMVFEDIERGIKSAKSAGFETCAVYDETNAQITDVLKQSADHYITGWVELCKQQNK